MKTLNILLYLFVITNFVLLGFILSTPTANVIYTIEKANITKIIDGDTFNTEIGKVRLLGINTPEKNEYYYEEAKIFLEQYETKQIDLIRLKENKDPYNRLLRYALFEKTLINEEILKQGLAHTFYYEDDEFTSRLLKAEEQARKAQLGIWEKSRVNCSKCIVLEKLNEIEPEYIILKNTCFFSCSLKNWSIKDEATHIKKLDLILLAQEKKQIDFEGKIWNDDKDSLFLRDEKGLLVLFYRYRR